MTSNILVCVWVNFQMSTSPVFYLKCSNIKMASSAYHMKAHCEFSGTSSEDSNRYRVKRSLNCKQEACFTFPQSSFFLVWVSQTLANLWSWGIYNSIKCQKYGILSYHDCLMNSTWCCIGIAGEGYSIPCTLSSGDL